VGRGSKEGKVFFSEEKKQKTSMTLSLSSQAAPTPEFAKVFCFFSSEKKTFLPPAFLRPRRLIASKSLTFRH